MFTGPNDRPERSVPAGQRLLTRLEEDEPTAIRQTRPAPEAPPSHLLPGPVLAPEDHPAAAGWSSGGSLRQLPVSEIARSAIGNGNLPTLVTSPLNRLTL
ncbi:hypothetical protein SAMN05216553_101204 [Lentzea fradiae]|uniref:Uncharacterized protein n=1 Tax=Lentzea fradiae TaxID=200378 RepID=A0A1G7KCA9_9PSEU|nr:hypothetical protein SAMN05216553_101204 [Lentzea fradiae]